MVTIIIISCINFIVQDFPVKLFSRIHVLDIIIRQAMPLYAINDTKL